MSGYMYLAIAILSEVIATSALKSSDGFTKFGPSLVVILGSDTESHFTAYRLS